MGFYIPKIWKISSSIKFLFLQSAAASLLEKCFASFSVYKQLWLFHGSKIRNLLPNKLGHGGFVDSLQNFKFENSKLVGNFERFCKNLTPLVIFIILRTYFIDRSTPSKVTF